ncbi:Disease resistance protein [Thalictrum thalictroides]|uniref:Disease resistance protein n=1 Tax=Thalictrum thalictroides TaxID=46969 RepID=A0A7J6VWW8_THATH|nr:Disease resistance protein [Thalictrum thalictroides]
MEIAGVLVGFVQCFLAPLSRQFKYLKNSKKDAEALLCSTEELIGRENDIKLQIDRAVNHIGKKSNSEVQIWLKNVERVRNEMNSIEKVLHEKARCVKGCFPNCHSRLKFAKHVEKIKNEKLPSLAKLKELRVLDLSYTYIRVLPKDIGSLTNLRRLDLSYTEKLQRFPGKVIPKLQHLENLSMFKSRCRWWSESAEMQRGACLAEIVNFRRLTNLGISFKDLNSLTSYVTSKHWKVLRSYHLGIGLLSRFVPISKGSFSVEIQGCNLVSDSSLIVLPENTLQLALQGCHDITRLSKLPCISNLSELKDCYISRCNKMECIALAEENILPCLDRLVLRKLSNLTALCDGVAGRSFAGLKVLHIHSCNGLKNLFSHRLLQQIQTLEEIEVWNSILIEEIVKDEENSTITLPRLRRLYFFSVPELRNIYNGVLICNSLTTIDIYDCQKLKKLPLSGGDLPLNLQHIKGSKKWWDALEWDNEGAQILLQPFFAEADLEKDDAELVGDRDKDRDDDDDDAEEDDDSDDDTFETAR